jgi:UDPglucose 6-dehydrogenase
MEVLMMNVSIVGAGYVGLTTGIALAYLGHKVNIIESDLGKLEKLHLGIIPFYEPHLEELFNISKSNLTFSDDVSSSSSSSVIMIAVGTPSKLSGEADTHFVEIVVREIAQNLVEDQNYVIAVKSTVPIGTNQLVDAEIRRILHSRNCNAQVLYASIPEFLREGKAIFDIFFPDRIVVGCSDENSRDAIRHLYQPILEQSFTIPSFLDSPSHLVQPQLVFTDFVSAEMIKYASNAFLSLKVSFINEIANLCDSVGADVSDVALGVGLDSRIGSRFLGAGIGWGGSCFPKDTAALVHIGNRYGHSMQIIAAAREVNWKQRQQMVNKIQAHLKVLRGRTIGVLGIAFKWGTDDVRDSPSLGIIDILLDSGVYVKVHDPVAIQNARKVLQHDNLEYCTSLDDLFFEVDALLFATEWPEYLAIDWRSVRKQMRNPYVFDGRNFLSKKLIHDAGLTYVGVGQ